MNLSPEEEKAITEYQESSRQKHTVYIEKSVNLNSTINFSQIIYKAKSLITLIGEIHEYNWTCPPPNINISDYCIERIKQNKNCRILLEYNPAADPKTIGSQAIRSVFNSMSNIENGNKYIIPFDFRSFFLTPKGQSELYDYDWKNTQKNLNEIKSKFILPYFDNFQSTFGLKREDYEPGIYNYLTKPFLEDTTQTFQAAGGQIERNYSIDKIQHTLKEAWKKVADFFILREILRESDINEYIVILGKKHFENLRFILSKMGEEINYQEGKPEKCVNLYYTYTFN